MISTRTPWQVTRSVWHALFMREALARTTADRMAWFWMLAEPIAIVAFMAGIRSLVASDSQHIGGADFIAWTIIGLLSFFLFRENMMRSIGAIDSSKALFAYRQVQPIDPVLVRCYLEGLLKTFVALLFILFCTMLDISLIPADSLGTLFIWVSIWLLGLGAGLVLSALATLVPEVGKLIRIVSMPLLLISGVIFPMQLVPHEFQNLLLFNPIIHGIESLRMSFFMDYRTVSGISLVYVWFWILIQICLGLMLHIRYAMKLKAQ